WAVEAGGTTVGSVFLGLRDGGAWLYDITIAEAERGRGYGRAAMVALEDEVRALGFDRVALNVWGGNAVARGLYRSLGYTEDSVHMSKPV
ncbi:MAG TPA: GNAT family N-acetyltransferase, partial [Gaiellaceae bacterium]|nr:GNAT family N-acetyltransferase [Gaiellaceae bacterium]